MKTLKLIHFLFSIGTSISILLFFAIIGCSIFGLFTLIINAIFDKKIINYSFINSLSHILGMYKKQIIFSYNKINKQNNDSNTKQNSKIIILTTNGKKISI